MALPAENNYPKSNLHTHTTYSDGKHTVEENILSAIEKGFVSIGISDHSFTEFDLSYCMKKESEKSYLEEIHALRDKYRDRIEVLCGLELDGYSKIDTSPYDYTVGSCHYVKTSDGYFSVDHCKEGHKALLDNYFDSDPDLFARCYFETVCELIHTQKPDIVGHFDLVSKFGFMREDSPAYLKASREALSAVMEVTHFIEINTGAIARGVRNLPYPAPYLWRDILEFGGKVVLSSDSHSRENLDFNFDESVLMLKSYGFDRIYYMKNSRLVEALI